MYYQGEEDIPLIEDLDRDLNMPTSALESDNNKPVVTIHPVEGQDGILVSPLKSFTYSPFWHVSEPKIAGTGIFCSGYSCMLPNS